MSRTVALLLLAAAVACRSVPSVPFRLEAEHEGPAMRFRLIAAPGARINARLKPALELTDGIVLRFDSPHLSADSAYFSDAPTAGGPLPEEAHRRGGVLRASVCLSDEKVCRSYELAVRW